MRDIGIVFGTVLTSQGCAAYISELEAYWLILVGLAVTKISMSWNRKKDML
jgi:hypothetical protein